MSDKTRSIDWLRSLKQANLGGASLVKVITVSSDLTPGRRNNPRRVDLLVIRDNLCDLLDAQQFFNQAMIALARLDSDGMRENANGAAVLGQHWREQGDILLAKLDCLLEDANALACKEA